MRDGDATSGLRAADIVASSHQFSSDSQQQNFVLARGADPLCGLESNEFSAANIEHSFATCTTSSGRQNLRGQTIPDDGFIKSGLESASAAATESDVLGQTIRDAVSPCIGCHLDALPSAESHTFDHIDFHETNGLAFSGSRIGAAPSAGHPGKEHSDVSIDKSHCEVASNASATRNILGHTLPNGSVALSSGQPCLAPSAGEDESDVGFRDGGLPQSCCQLGCAPSEGCEILGRTFLDGDIIDSDRVVPPAGNDDLVLSSRDQLVEVSCSQFSSVPAPSRDVLGQTDFDNGHYKYPFPLETTPPAARDVLGRSLRDNRLFQCEAQEKSTAISTANTLHADVVASASEPMRRDSDRLPFVDTVKRDEPGKDMLSVSLPAAGSTQYDQIEKDMLSCTATTLSFLSAKYGTNASTLGARSAKACVSTPIVSDCTKVRNEGSAGDPLSCTANTLSMLEMRYGMREKPSAAPSSEPSTAAVQHGNSDAALPSFTSSASGQQGPRQLEFLDDNRSGAHESGEHSPLYFSEPHLSNANDRFANKVGGVQVEKSQTLHSPPPCQFDAVISSERSRTPQASISHNGGQGSLAVNPLDLGVLDAQAANATTSSAVGNAIDKLGAPLPSDIRLTSRNDGGATPRLTAENGAASCLPDPLSFSFTPHSRSVDASRPISTWSDVRSVSPTAAGNRTPRATIVVTPATADCVGVVCRKPRAKTASSARKNPA
eukprot:TRINITY_DN17899_c0_g2_i1.p1 TRINITY_DN17899_c0_g2~~TRINITY_DN17899_c0_g2_i1.p1  ORF type:complete len:832 (+),score=51.64 TRINITY_DN17899_c0_g2_i1:341-2497(+)